MPTQNPASELATESQKWVIEWKGMVKDFNEITDGHSRHRNDQWENFPSILLPTQNPASELATESQKWVIEWKGMVKDFNEITDGHSRHRNDQFLLGIWAYVIIV